MYNQTLCFIKRTDELLMINREKSPNMGMWNGVGGKAEQGESAIQCAIREILEETGIHVLAANTHYKGSVSWIEEHQKTGMDLFLIEVEKNFTYNIPKKTAEGILDWKKVEWLMDSRNRGVSEMLQQILPTVLNEASPVEHVYTYENGDLVQYEKRKMVQI
ncbi:DNA mismatch repair protein MutT [Solibacillus sp. R5-41]|uniref:NUDIX hydrolase n=1 Tax=Solibacillus sp. R5-41 TaxID=2048654 RepID=UPI000C12926E|nr:8-oxo-dGTP diphosphatase [Solibacillus sp. R5-41]ATP39723.1 DNA mismatch repair protein MutT [Solibacillus sp. R5-41]